MSCQWSPPFYVSTEVQKLAEQVRLALFDVDGVLTDGSLYIGDDGKETKCFHVHDGHGLKMLKTVGIEIGMITARTSDALRNRAEELQIKHIFMGQIDKLTVARKLSADLKVDLSQCCYTGDDVVDIPLLRACGLAVAVNDANEIVKRVAHWVTPRPGGRGAARDVCDLILYAQRKYDDILSGYFQRTLK